MVECILALDGKLFALINSGMVCPFLDTTMPIITDFFIWRYVLLALLLFLLFANKGRYRALMLTMILAAGITDVTSSRVIKKCVQRPRPCCVEPSARKLMGCKSSESFPSSHAANTFAVASVVSSMQGLAVGVPFLILAAVISFSRVYVGVHYPFDCLYGMLLGLFLGWLVFRLARGLYGWCLTIECLRRPLKKLAGKPADGDSLKV